jgi:peroxiredoxin
LGALFEQHGSAPAAVLGVAVGSDDAQSAARFQHSAGFPYPTGIDSQRRVRAAYRLTRVPTVVLINPDGTVARAYVGGRDEMIAAVTQALEAVEKGQPVPEYDLLGGG